MDESRRKRVEELFQHCVTLPPGEWRRHLEARCDDPDVRAAVEERLLEEAGRHRSERFDPSWASDPGESLDALEGRHQAARELGVEARGPGRDPSTEAASTDEATRDSAAASQPSGTDAELPDPATVGESDVFISYAAVDDQPLSADRQGWVSLLHRNLEVRMQQISGEPVKIWRYPGQAETPPLGEGWLASIPRAKTLVAVVSPHFVESPGCRRQVDVFRDAAEREGNLRLESGSRVFKVVKRPAPPAAVPPQLAELLASLLDFDFFEVDPHTGRVREYDHAFGQMAILRYHERVYDLARSICDVLTDLRDRDARESGLASAGGATIYLATTTPELEPRRDRVRRELLARGHSVLPDRPLPLVAREVVAAVDEFLERCEYAVHIVGGAYGVVPEGMDRSLPELQNRLAAGHAARRRLRRLIWIPRGVDVRDARQERWIEELRTDRTQRRGAEVTQDRFDGVKALLLRRLAEQAERARNPGREKPPRVYLICDRRDEEAVEEIEDFFFERGVEASLPPFATSEVDAPRIHLENLRYCDAALIYYGAAGRRWVESHLRDLAKASGYRESGPIPVQVVYLAPPFDRRKERFTSLSAEVLRQGERFEPRDLDPLVVRILEARTDG